MLIDFSFNNWKSFRDETTFSMQAGREKQHRERLASIQDYTLSLLPVSAIYGGNASGKSNFVKALEFCKDLVCGIEFRPGKVIPVSTFRLDSECMKQPAQFSFTLLADNDIVYEYTFSVTKDVVLEESLVRCGTKSSNDDVVVFKRGAEDVELDQTLPEKEKDRLTFIREGTHSNQLFLTNAISQKVKNKDLQAVFDWFNRNLMIITPKTTVSLKHLSKDEWGNICSVLSQLDTGIKNFIETEISLDESTASPDSLDFLEFVKEQLADGPEPTVSWDDTNFRMENGKLKATRLGFEHESANGNAQFRFSEESDGTKRAIDLLPAFFEIASKESRRMFVVDEIDQSMHTLMIQALVKSYLASCNENTRSQLIFTTHNVMLMDQEIFRRDEIWVTERQNEGQSKLYSFAEFKDVRSDKKLRKSYLQGRMGGIPEISLHGPF